MKLEGVEKEKAKERQISTQNNNKGKAVKDNLPEQENKGQTRDKVAKRVGRLLLHILTFEEEWSSKCFFEHTYY